ncbi:MAG: ATP-binding cassette domain-containing protein [Anaerolineae bacterium]|nr:ATP-binding cassette domain-containing protein [Anaerolineae bacterium]
MPILELKHVSRHFGGLLALEDVNMIVEVGKVVGLIGPRQKTTMINNISGLDHPTNGEILFQGQAIHKQTPHKITQIGITRTYQNIRLFGDMTAHDNLLIGQHARGRATLLESLFFLPRYLEEERTLRQRATELLAQFGLDKYGDIIAGDQRR